MLPQSLTLKLTLLHTAVLTCGYTDILTYQHADKLVFNNLSNFYISI